MIFPILFCFVFYRANTLNINVAYNIIKSALDYYNSHSVLLIFDEPHNDLFNLLTLQKRLSWANNFYYSTITTRSVLLKALENYRQSPRETVVIWNPNENFPHVLEEFSNDIDFTTHKWFVATSSLTSEAFNNVTIPLHSEFTIAKGNPQSGYSLEEIYDVTPGVRLSNSLGRWLFNTQKFQIHASTYMFNRRKDFKGALIKVASPMEDTCNMIMFLMDNTMVAVCTSQLIWFTMEKILNATTEILVVPDLNEDTIKDEDVDLTFRFATATSFHMNTRDYVWPTFHVDILLALSTTSQKFRWKTFISPFTDKMWIVIVIWIILWDLVIAFVEFIKEGKKSKISLLDSYNEISFTTMFSFCNQEVACPSQSFSIRIILLMMFIVPGVLFPGYSAVLTSFLTVQLDKKPIRNLEEFSHDKEYKVGWNKAFHVEDYFTLENNYLSAEIRYKMKQARNDMAQTDAQGIDRMCNEKYSYVTIAAILQANAPKCKHYTLDDRIVMFCISMELKKGSWYKFFLDRCLKAIYYSGMRTQMVLRKIKEYVQLDSFDGGPGVDESEFSPVKVENIVLPFVVLLLGVAIAVIVLMFEIIFFSLKSKRLSKSRSLSIYAGHKSRYEFVL